jgi:hypothetical protein
LNEANFEYKQNIVDRNKETWKEHKFKNEIQQELIFEQMIIIWRKLSSNYKSM